LLPLTLVFRFMPIFSIAFVLLLSCSMVTPPNLVVVVVGGVTKTYLLYEIILCWRLNQMQGGN
jgi:hypothetical protein